MHPYLLLSQIFEKNNLEFAFPSMSIYHETDTPKVAHRD
jgi:hypothetical protein